MTIALPHYFCTGLLLHPFLTPLQSRTMRKSYLVLILSALAITIVLLLTACSKAGSKGASGPAGPIGPAGQQGTPGPAGSQLFEGNNKDPGTLYSPTPVYNRLTDHYLYRIVLIPGGVLGTSVDPHTLTYNEVCKKFGIQP